MLLDVTPRSRCVHASNGVLVTLVRPDRRRDVDRQDLDLWIESNRVITICRGADSLAADAAQRVDAGVEHGDGMTLLAVLTVTLARPMEAPVSELVDIVDDLEDDALKNDDSALLTDVNNARHDALAMRRRLNAIRDVVSTLALNPEPSLRDLDLNSLRRAADYLGHLVTRLDATRDRLILLFDQLSASEQQRINRAMQKLAVVGTVFLPLSFITGLLGINVAGIPDSHNPLGFWLVCAFLGVNAIVALLIIKWKKWI
jgi:zinc transporter